jgi:HSP20 family protein
MTALLPRLFGDVSDWIDNDLSLRPAQLIRVEELVSEQEYQLRAEIPGLNPEKDLTVIVADNILTIRAERKQEEHTAHRTEFRYGILQRTVRLPANADEEKITARYHQGILDVVVPLAAAKPTGRTIPIATDG